jgi:hypothetical protein
LPPAIAVVALGAVLAFAAVWAIGDWIENTARGGVSRERAVNAAIDAVSSSDLPFAATVPRGAWQATFVEYEPDRVVHFHAPGAVGIARRAPCMRPLGLQWLACSEAPIWYVHLEAKGGLYTVDVAVDARYGSAAILQAGSGFKPPPPPLPTPTG